MENSSPASDAGSVRPVSRGSLAFLLAISSWVGAAGAQAQGAQDPDSTPRHFEPFPSRWYSPNYPQSGIQPPAYELNRPGSPWNSYNQNPLKGDFPLWGSEDLFMNLTVTDRLILESRRAPSGDESFFANDLAVTIDLFRGQQAFKPVDWRLRITPVIHYSQLDAGALGVVNVDPAQGKTRSDSDIALQEAFFGIHLFDLGDAYDFVSAEVGILPFRSDFRGFLFDDTNLGIRVFGNADANRWQYNLAYFDQLSKNTNSLLNELESRDQRVFIANLYRQDWPVHGYTTSVSVHHNDDRRGTGVDANGFPIVTQTNAIEATYIGWTGEGHIAGFNITHALYQVIGEESNNAIAGRSVDINAQMAALELSYDIDWWRVRMFGLYASGDDDANDGHAEGFDAILDSPVFAGGELSYFSRQSLRLSGTRLTGVGSPLPDLQTSKFEGQSNFVNPGLLLLGGALDLELTPRWRAQIGASYLRFVTTEPLETLLTTSYIERYAADADLWPHIVGRMRGKAPQWISEAEAKSIIEYLQTLEPQNK